MKLEEAAHTEAVSQHPAAETPSPAACSSLHLQQSGIPLTLGQCLMED